ncbi:AAA family ATPase [Candidatus Poribacteria bacterium]|nr:AAA family ATPase [Candidatus Poribacteria bacterium]
MSRYEASLQESTEDGTFAFFGASVARENDPERAFRAALKMMEAVAQVGMNLSVGINTGMADLGQIGMSEHTEIGGYGPEVNLAKRLCDLAPPGQILVGERTYRLTYRAFEFRTQPPLTLKGVAEPVRAYQALTVLPKPEKVRGIPGLTAPMIGRDGEFATLTRYLDRMMAGSGQIVSIIGPAGVGKSRLVAELKSVAIGQGDKETGGQGEGREEGKKRKEKQQSAIRARPIGSDNPQSAIWLEGRCLSSGESVSYGPFIDSLKSDFRFDATDDTQRMAEKITTAVRDLLPEQADEILPLFGNLLSVKLGTPWDERLKFVASEQIQRQTFTALRDFFCASALKQPLVLVLEGDCWLGGSTLFGSHFAVDGRAFFRTVDVDLRVLS